MIIKQQPFLIHNHTEMSNFRLKDSIIKVEELLNTAAELNLDGICITDHEALSGHIRAYQHQQKMIDKYKKLSEDNLVDKTEAIKKMEYWKNFKIGYGNEIYLIDRDEFNTKKENNERIQFYHAILLAKNERGYKAIRKLSTMAWNNHVTYRGMERVPLFYDELVDIMQQYRGDVIFSTACVGGYLPQQLLIGAGFTEDEKYIISKEERQAAQNNVREFMELMLALFGEDFYIELQPGDREIQLKANQLLYLTAKEYGVKPIITTDTHYLKLEDRDIHRVYLQSQQGNREVDDFYSTTYLMNREYLEKHFFSSDKDKLILDELIENTREIRDKIEDLSVGRQTQITKAHIPEYFEPATVFDEYRETHPYIGKMLDSKYEADRYYMKLLEDGAAKLGVELTKDKMDRIELEVEQLVKLTEYFGDPMSGYFLATKEIVDLIWEISFVAPNRGSAACYYTNYLLEIVQIDAIEHELPYWRFLHEARGKEMPDKNIVWNAA